MSYGMRRILDQPFAPTLKAVREALAGQGFGVLTEIDTAATLRAKLGVETEPHVILGACNPPLAHRSLQAEAAIGLLLPCNVVVRSDGKERTIVEALDPRVMVKVTRNPDLRDIADEASRKLVAALDALDGAQALEGAA